MLLPLLLLVFVLGLALAARVYAVLPRRDRPQRRDSDTRPTRSLAVFLGSGGHTAEMRALLRSLDRRKYSPRIYVYGAGDALSLLAVSELEEDTKSAEYSLLALPRARAVGEGKLSTLVSASRTLAVALWHTFLLPLAERPSEPWADVLVLNGPGTAAVLVLVAYIRRVSQNTVQKLTDRCSGCGTRRLCTLRASRA